MKKGDFFKSKNNGGSHFCKGLHKVKHLFKCEAIHKVGNGQCTQFWNDNVWLKNVPLRICYPRIYNICRDTNMYVSKGAKLGWQLEFRRMMGLEELDEWEDLMKALEEVNLNQEEDKISWGLSANKIFSTSSLYRFLTLGESVTMLQKRSKSVRSHYD
jgi:hypothetical protein